MNDHQERDDQDESIWMDQRVLRSIWRTKAYLASPPLLSPSKPNEELSLYLVVSLTVISSALIQKKDRVQLPIYYTSEALRGVKERYPL